MQQSLPRLGCTAMLRPESSSSSSYSLAAAPSPSQIHRAGTLHGPDARPPLAAVRRDPRLLRPPLASSPLSGASSYTSREEGGRPLLHPARGDGARNAVRCDGSDSLLREVQV